MQVQSTALERQETIQGPDKAPTVLPPLCPSGLKTVKARQSLTLLEPQAILSHPVNLPLPLKHWIVIHVH